MRHKTQLNRLSEESYLFDIEEYEDEVMHPEDIDKTLTDQPEKSDAHIAAARRAIEDLMEEKRLHRELDYLEDFDFDEFDDLLGDEDK